MNSRIVFSDARLLKDVVDAVSAVLEFEATLKIAEDKIAICGMDSAHIALVNLELSHSAFEEWDVQPGEVTLSLTDIRKVLKTKKNQKALLEINEEDVRIVLMDQAGSTFKTFTFKTIEKAEEAPKIPELGFTAEARLSSNAVSDSISQLAKIDSQIKVTINESVEFEAKNESVKAVERYDPNGNFVYDFKVDKPAEAYYSAGYLEKIAKAAKKLTDEIKIRLASNKPIEIAPLFPGGSLTYLVAPIVGEA
ncbi:MAG: hypothetical protein ACXQTR_05625 [Candidatus Methanospirareceae archaeon]